MAAWRSLKTERFSARISCAIALAGCLFAAPATHAQSQAPAQPSAVQLASLDRIYEDPQSTPGKTVLSADDEKFLDDIEQRGLRFFIDESDPTTGLIRDRANAHGGVGNNPDDAASIASVGFGLTAYCIGAERGWMTKQDAYDRSLRVIKFMHDRAPAMHGTFYHFLNMRTGSRMWQCEVSNIDTALLMTGVITARQYFPNTELAKVADDLYQNVDWPWLLTPDGPLWMGYRPERGHEPAKWENFCEGPMIYLLAMGSHKHPLSASAWGVWRRWPIEKYDGLTFMSCPPLFTHQYPQCWYDLRGLRDDYADYFRDSQLATIAQRQWCMNDLSKRFSDYGPNLWGLTASDYDGGYTAWGGPPEQGNIDGTVVPTAAGGSVAFEPRLCLDCLESMKKSFKDAYQKYGFVDSFNPQKAWYNSDVLGIDVGPMVLMAENCRSGFVWKTFMSAPEAQAAIKEAGFRPLSEEEKSSLSNSSMFYKGN
jgi:hypothetical protein